jgi:hypothetical protein
VTYFLFGTTDLRDGYNFGMASYQGKFDSPKGAYDFAIRHDYDAAQLAHTDNTGDLVLDGDLVKIVIQIDADNREVIAGWGIDDGFDIEEQDVIPAVINIEVDRWKERRIPPAPVAPYEQPKPDPATGVISGTIVMWQAWPQDRWERVDE